MSPLRFAASRSTWLTPVVLILGLAILFPAIYLSATVNPQGNLHGMQIGLVVENQKPSAAANDAADKLASAIRTNIDHSKFRLSTLTGAQLKERMAHDSIAGAIVIPADFNGSIASLFSSRASAAVTVPAVQVRTNAGDGGISTGLVTGNLTPLLTAVQHGFGAKLLPMVEANGEPVTGAQRYLLQTPFTVVATPYLALPDNSGLGTSALYYTLVLVLIGFIGASVINPLVDSALGFAPSEVGPVVARKKYVALSRLQTLLTKFGIILLLSPVAAALVQLIATLVVGVQVGNPVLLWLFSAATIAAIGSSALTVFAIFGSGLGSLANTLFFIALSMTASGGTVPIAATPPFFKWISAFEPFRAIVGGARSLLYFGGDPTAGLIDGWIRIGIGGSIGILLGLIVTYLYGRKREFSRDPKAEVSALSAA